MVMVNTTAIDAGYPVIHGGLYFLV